MHHRYTLLPIMFCPLHLLSFPPAVRLNHNGSTRFFGFSPLLPPSVSIISTNMITLDYKGIYSSITYFSFPKKHLIKSSKSSKICNCSSSNSSLLVNPTQFSKGSHTISLLFFKSMHK